MPLYKYVGVNLMFFNMRLHDDFTIGNWLCTVLKFTGTINNLNGETGAIDETAAIRESFPIVGAPFAAGCVSANESLFTGG